MAELTDLTDDPAPTGDDLIYLVSDPAGTPVDRKVTLTNLAASAPFAAASSAAGYVLVSFDQSVRPGGDATATTTSTTWATIDTDLDLVLTAATGDVLETGISVCGIITNAASSLMVDAHTLVSGTRTNSVASKTTVSNSHEGVCAWRIAAGSGATITSVGIGAPVFYTLQSGDISGGTVTLRHVFRVTSASHTGSLFNSADIATETWAKVWRAE